MKASNDDRSAANFLNPADVKEGDVLLSCGWGKLSKTICLLENSVRHGFDIGWRSSLNILRIAQRVVKKMSSVPSWFIVAFMRRMQNHRENTD